MNRLDRQPEIVPHHDDALHPAAVALPQGLHQFGVLLAALGVEPLLELVQDDQHLLARCQEPPLPQGRQRLDQAEVARAGPGSCRRKPLSRRASVSSAVAST